MNVGDRFQYVGTDPSLGGEYTVAMIRGEGPGAHVQLANGVGMPLSLSAGQIEDLGDWEPVA